MTVMTAVAALALNPIAGLQAEVGSRSSNKTSHTLLLHLVFFIQIAKLFSARLNKMPQNVQDKLKLVTPAVVFSETQLH